MDILSIAKTVGASIIGAHPLGALALGVVNEFLPEDKKLSKELTGNQVVQKIETLSPELKAQVITKQFDVTLEQIKQQHTSIQTMLSTEATSKHTTRPKIALGSFWVLAITTIIAVLIWGYAVAANNPTMVKAVMDGWAFLVVLTGTFTTLLLAYFGILRDEKRDTLNASQGLPAGAASIMGKLMGKLKL